MSRLNTSKYKPTYLLTLVFFLSLSANFLYGQYIVKTCAEAGLTPKMVDQDGDGVNETNLLNIFFPDSTSTEPQCLVFSQPRRNEFIVAPMSWTPSPTGNRKRLLDANFEAVVKTRGEYNRYGNSNWDWYFLIAGNTFDEDAEAYEFGSECWMRSMGWLDDAGTVNNFKQTVAHESGHCFLMENYGQSRVGPSGVTELSRYHTWLDESTAEFLSTFVYPENNLEFQYATDFDMDGSTFKQAYNAYTILQHYADKQSKEAVLENVIEESYYKSVTQLIPFYRSISFDEHLQNFYFHHYQERVNDSGGGSIPRESDVGIKATYDLLPPLGGLTLENIKPERLTVFELVIPADYDAILQFPVDGSDEAFYSIVADEQKVEKWTKQETIRGYCDGANTIKVLVSHLNDADVRGAKISYELRERVGCCSAVTVVGVNPSDINEVFHFDYYIDSDIIIDGGGTTMAMDANYYVNSKDGSILFLDEFVLMNFDKALGRQYDFHAAIWLPNGQMVAYVLDKSSGIKRAITIATDQTRSDVFRVRADRIRDFLQNAPGSGIDPAPLPSGSQWLNRSNGYATYQADVIGKPDLNLMSVYISNEPLNISSPLPSFGFMVGFIKDHRNRNRLLVYNNIKTADDETMEAELNALFKDCRMFDGNGYEPMTMTGDLGRIGSMSSAERDALVAQQLALQEQMIALMAELQACGDNAACQADIERRMLELQKLRRESIYDLPGNPNYTGNEGSEFENEKKDIEDRMYALEEQRIDKDLECSRIGRQYEVCASGGGGAACGPIMVRWNACKDELVAMKEQMEDLQCELAKLMGIKDLADDCF